ncbi:hypothetical protein [Vibrio metschnikovii]|uniref:hypothetical protein n=1 Tax=Vibrio metschnikovii TaxID=28172 RepID=UPI001C30CB41|nr:hypothetical protein [Vibrio metschnikovii]EKO3565507.1 hypothetical protein [Vibrio metschnikovii]EKO3769087.1 hypothetical protein [Vibrio metschnikovii]
MKILNLNGIATTIVAAWALSSGTAIAAVSVDENGVGFVGKGDVQQVFDWNNSKLQENAHNLQFRMATTGTTTWTCEGINPAGIVVIQQYEQLQGVNSSVAFDPRRNRTGQITGFHMNGIQTGDEITYTPLGSCGNNGNGHHNWVVKPTLVDDINYLGSDEPSLEVSVDGMNWVALPISYF